MRQAQLLKMKDIKSSVPRWSLMKFVLPLLLTFHFSFFIIQCGLDVEDPILPLPPTWVQKSLPEEWPERGIDAHESGGIFLEWEPATQGDIIAYHIYRAQYSDIQDGQGDYKQIATVELVSLPSMTFVDDKADVGIKYLYKLKALDSSGKLSSFSDSLMYSLLIPIESSGMIPNGYLDVLGSEKLLSWNYPYYLEMEDYTLTITSLNNLCILRVVLSPGSYTGSREFYCIPEAVHLERDQIYKWRIDAAATYVDGLESLGTESEWATFINTASTL